MPRKVHRLVTLGLLVNNTGFFALGVVGGVRAGGGVPRRARREYRVGARSVGIRGVAIGCPDVGGWFGGMVVLVVLSSE